METPFQAAQRWHDWAYQAYSAQKWSDAAYNADQFDAIFWTALDQGQTQEEADRLNTWQSEIAVLRSLLAERNTWTIANSWWAPFVPGKTQAAIQTEGQKAQEAAKAAYEAAKAAGNTRLMAQAQSQLAEAKANAAKEAANAPNAFLDALKFDLLGVPAWAWLAGLGALWILGKRR